MGGLSISEKQSIIGSKIHQVYILYGKSCSSKNELLEKILVSLTQDEQKYYEDKDIKIYFNSQLDLIWKKIEDDEIYKRQISDIIDEKMVINKFQEKYDATFAKILNDHQNEILSLEKKIRGEEEEKLRKSEEKYKVMYNELQERIKKIEAEAENERKNMKKRQKEIEENFQKNKELLKKQFQEERNEEQRRKLEKKKKN